MGRRTFSIGLEYKSALPGAQNMKVMRRSAAFRGAIEGHSSAIPPGDQQPWEKEAGFRAN